MSRRSKEEWLQDIEARQRNTIFPDTVQNEGRFWRNIYTGTQPLNLAQWIGILLIFFFFTGTAVFFAVVLSMDYEGPWWQRLFRGFGSQIIVTAAVILFVVIGNYRFRRRNRKH